MTNLEGNKHILVQFIYQDILDWDPSYWELTYSVKSNVMKEIVSSNNLVNFPQGQEEKIKIVQYFEYEIAWKGMADY